MLYSLLSNIKGNPAWYSIENAHDLEVFITGYLFACNLYGSNKPENFVPNCFLSFVKDKYKIKIERSWGEIIDFFSVKNGTLQAFELINEYSKFPITKDKSMDTLYPSMPFHSYKELIVYLKGNFSNIGLNSVKDFYVFDIGFRCYNHPLPRAYAIETNHIQDDTFINLIDNDFISCVRECLGIAGQGSGIYHKMIDFCAMNNKQAIALLFSIIEKYDDFMNKKEILNIKSNHKN
ncbi:MAG: hypothetical protein MUE81_09940 [Thermoflexibacter sp.]|jgi:hypothetical protein|nr:hypothetical protein [Thermoflexibacter sp.]